METALDFTCNFFIVVSLVYLGGGLILELIDRWNQTAPSVKKTTAITPVPQPALPAASAPPVQVKLPEQETWAIETSD